jgi:hypothetical protein
VQLDAYNYNDPRCYIPIILIPYCRVRCDSYNICPLLLRCKIIIKLIWLSSIHQGNIQVFIACCIAVYCDVVVEPSRLVIYSFCYYKPVVIKNSTFLHLLIYINRIVDYQFVLWIKSFDSVIWWSIWHSYNSSNYSTSSCSKTCIV